MVRLINRENMNKLGGLLKSFFRFQRNHTHMLNINYPKVRPCIFVLWHGQQFSVYGLEDIPNTNIMISTSADGQIIAEAVEMLGFKTVRGSTARRGSVSATMQLIERLKNNEYAVLTVDGPRGPARKVKGGVVKIAKTAGVPIVPMCWYSGQFNFVAMPSWDKMTSPFGPTWIVNLYGEPIYVDKDMPDEDDHLIIEKIQTSLEEVERRAPEAYAKARRDKAWK